MAKPLFIALFTGAKARWRTNQSLQKLNDILFFSTGQESIGFRKFTFKIRSVTRRHAASHDQLCRTLFQRGKPRKFKDGIKAFLCCALNERAGVDNNRLRALGVIDNRVTRVQNALFHVVGVNFVFRASKCYECDGGIAVVVHP